jgi:guanylate kinase
MDSARRARQDDAPRDRGEGTRQLRERGVAGLYVFIAPPGIEELRARLERRGSDSAEEIAQRIAIAEGEIRAARELVDGVPLYDVTT